MKRIAIIILVLLMPLVAMSQGQLYKQYASRPGLTVAQVDGFKLNDSVGVDVVMLQAENDEAWQKLIKEFDIRGTETVVSWLGNPQKPAQHSLLPPGKRAAVRCPDRLPDAGHDEERHKKIKS